MSTMAAQFPGASAPRFALAKTVGWVALLGFLSVVLYQSSWQAIGDVVANPSLVVDEALVHQWGVLVLTLGALALRWRRVRDDMSVGTAAPFVALGVIEVLASIFFFPPAALILGALGLFTMLFGRAAIWPSVFCALYLIGAGFPALAERFLDAPLGFAAAVPSAGVLELLGVPNQRSGAFISIPGPTNEIILVSVTAACSGPATIGVFLILFALMWLELPIKGRRFAALLLVGLAGTWVQNIARIVYLMILGHTQGEDVLWAAHGQTGYVPFLLWYALFAVIYMRYGFPSQKRTAPPLIDVSLPNPPAR